ncbi:MAG: pyridoxamine 5'-phosphate oxidase family protein [Proteobacteria bacterium]|nr:pyridoxamine 5'-phosphate oxidase family protein [Pseudomonadota bacterium]MBU1595981.1 pyridoxamine 5'-phosphate oxidase family protein [Pseudomonadota bacterium]
MLKKILALVHAQRHLVLATSAPDGRGGRPHCSLMAYCPSGGGQGDGLEFWVATLADTRKFVNLRANPRASLLIDDRAGGQGDGPGLALTVEAELRPFGSAEAEAHARQALLARHPELAGFLALEGTVVLRLLALRSQLLSGLTDVFIWTPQKSLDGQGRNA